MGNSLTIIPNQVDTDLRISLTSNLKKPTAFAVPQVFTNPNFKVY